MAAILKLDSNNANGQRVLNALDQIRQGIGTLQELDGLRANAIGTSQTEMQGVFGAASTSDAQGVSDRWGAFLAAYEDGSNAELAKLRDLISAVSYVTS